MASFRLHKGLGAPADTMDGVQASHHRGLEDRHPEVARSQDHHSIGNHRVDVHQ